MQVWAERTHGETVHALSEKAERLYNQKRMLEEDMAMLQERRDELKEENDEVHEAHISLLIGSVCRRRKTQRTLREAMNELTEGMKPQKQQKLSSALEKLQALHDELNAAD